MSVTAGLIALFRDRGAVLTPEHLSRMGRLTRDMHGSGKMRDLPAPMHVREEDIMRLLKVPDIEHLLYEIHYLNKYIEEEFLFKVGLSFHPRRSDARMLKPTSKVPEPPTPAPKVSPMRQVGGEDPYVLLKKKKLEGAADHVQEAHDHIYEVEVKALEQQCIDEGFIQGFLKGVRLVQQKAGVEVEGLTLSQASDDFPPDSDGNEIESELQKACALEVDDEVVDIE
ncbi:hypothetical protein IEQ34_003416 [Dendrobium chrysotoxum]|uniref:Uncharacterized protein n=1 Tax=Dendrobium chrysotoxum TaxID=161865 RepID=A0AAV7HL92_DENCH|nr:hypothetical protein IEQ34_003416 [Dendrobium chrysotoxum]